jgi:hypothetical protein
MSRWPDHDHDRNDMMKLMMLLLLLLLLLLLMMMMMPVVVCSMALGAAESFNSPCAFSLLARRFDLSNRSQVGKMEK